MNWQNSIPTYSPKQTSQVILLEAEPGQSRCDHLQQWLNQAQRSGSTTWLLSCDRDRGGPWAGLNDLLSNLVPQMQVQAPDLLANHDYELVHILPALRRTISVRYLNLTDKASEDELGRYYPAVRAFRIAYGLIDLLTAWHQRSNSSPWVIACDHYDRAGTLVRRFFVELMRRAGEQLNLTLLLATDVGASETVAGEFNPKYQGQCIRLNLPILETTSVCKQEMTRLAQELEIQVGNDLIELEIHLPQLIRYWLHSDQPQKALKYQVRACSIYTRRGFYEDGIVYGEAALAQLERHCPEDKQQRWTLYSKLYGCYASLGRPMQALQVMEAAIMKIDAPEHLFHYCYMMAMLYARFLPDLDLVKAEAYLECGLEELTRADLPEHTKLFQTSFNRNGLAMIRHRQGRFHEAVELCRSHYERLNTHLEPDQYRLHRSTLLYNIARVYGVISSYDEAIAYFTAAIAMDPNYSEYYNDRGNLYFKSNRLDNALNDYLKAIELSPPYSEVWANLGQCYRLMGRMAEAIDAYSTSLDLDLEQVSVLVARAQAFEMLEKPHAALADYSAALTLNPNQPLILANRAILHYDAERYREALADLDRAIALAPDTPDLYQNRAVAFTVLGRLEEAARDLQTYLQLSPHTEDRFEVESQLLALQANLVNFTSC